MTDAARTKGAVEPREIVADQTRLSFDRGEIRVDFGTISEPGADGTITVDLSSRVVLAPSTARRLVMALGEALRGEVGRVAAGPPPPPARPRGPAPGSRRPPLAQVLDPTSDLDSSRAAPSSGAAASALLLEVVAGFGVPYANERSLRLRPKALLSNRFLLTVGLRALGEATARAGLGGPAELLAATFERLGMPAERSVATLETLASAQAVHFGFEADENSHLYKVYLEMKPSAASDSSDGDTRVHYVATKWDPEAPARCVVSRYLLHDGISEERIREQLEAIYADSAGGGSHSIALEALDLAAARMPTHDMNYMEIEEDGNARRSFDLNFYDAGLRVRDLQPLLARMRDQYAIPAGRFQLLYDQIKTRRFGHLAGGVHRDGSDFFNVYFGAQLFEEGLWRDSFRADQLR